MRGSAEKAESMKIEAIKVGRAPETGPVAALHKAVVTLAIDPVFSDEGREVEPMVLPTVKARGQWNPVSALISLGLNGVLALVAFVFVMEIGSRTPNLVAIIPLESDLEVREDLFETEGLNFQSITPQEPTPNEQAPLRGADLAPPVDHTETKPLNLAEGARFDTNALLNAGTGPAGLGAGAGVEGGTGEVEFLKVKTKKAGKVVFVIDRSMSMKHNEAMDFAKEELLKSLDRLSAGMQFQVIFYNTEPLLLPLGGKNLISASPAFRDRARQAILDVVPDGGTDHRKALLKALELVPDVVFFLSDADDPEKDIERLVKDITSRNHQNSKKRKTATIHVLQFHHDEKRPPNDRIKDLAEQNLGTYRLVETFSQ